MRDALGSVQSALVLGASSEIAQAIVRRLVAGRTRLVVLAAREPAGVEHFAEELRAKGVIAETCAFDARDLAGHRGVIDTVWQRHGDIDLLLVAFGVLGSGAAQAALAGEAEPALELARVNYLGAVSALISATARLRAQGHGLLVVVSSVAAERPRADNFPYAASKAAVDSFAQGLGDALADTGVRVLVVRPGFVHTRMTAGLRPAPLATTPAAVADVVVEGLRRGARTVWAPPLVRWLMLMLRSLPRALFRRLRR